MSTNTYKIYTLHADSLEYILEISNSNATLTVIENDAFILKTPEDCISHHPVKVPPGFVPVYISEFKGDADTYRCISGYDWNAWYNYRIAYNRDGKIDLILSGKPTTLVGIIRDNVYEPSLRVAVLNKDPAHNNILAVSRNDIQDISIVYLNIDNSMPANSAVKQLELPEYDTLICTVPLNGHYWAFVTDVNNSLKFSVMAVSDGIIPVFPVEDSAPGTYSKLPCKIDIGIQKTDILTFNMGHNNTTSSIFHNTLETDVDGVSCYVFILGCFVRIDGKLVVKLLSVGPYACDGVDRLNMSVGVESVTVPLEDDLTPSFDKDVASVTYHPPVLHVLYSNKMGLLIRADTKSEFYTCIYSVTYENLSLSLNKDHTIVKTKL